VSSRAGSTCEQLTPLGDLWATVAELAESQVPENGGEDSVSIVPLLHSAGPVCDCAVHHSMQGQFALRRGEWVLIDAPTGGDNDEPEWLQAERGYEMHDCPVELYDLREDLLQRKNRYTERPQLVAKMRELLEQVQAGKNQGLAGAETL
jgi:arylsulfatase A